MERRALRDAASTSRSPPNQPQAPYVQVLDTHNHSTLEARLLGRRSFARRRLDSDSDEDDDDGGRDVWWTAHMLEMLG